MLGLSGALTNPAATYVGLKVQDKFDSKLAGALTAAATGTALAAAAGHLFGGGASIPVAIMGGVCGVYSTLRGNKEAIFRDAGAWGLTVAVPFEGGAKAGVALSGVLAAEFDNELARGAAGLALGGAAGALFGMTGHSKLSVIGSALAGGAVAAFAATGGHRLGNVMRNMTEDLSEKMTNSGEKAEDEPKTFLEKTAGALPMALVRQGGMSLIMGKLSLADWKGSLITVGTGFAIDATLTAYDRLLAHKAAEAQQAESPQAPTPEVPTPEVPEPSNPTTQEPEAS